MASCNGMPMPGDAVTFDVSLGLSLVPLVDVSPFMVDMFIWLVVTTLI